MRRNDENIRPSNSNHGEENNADSRVETNPMMKMDADPNIPKKYIERQQRLQLRSVDINTSMNIKSENLSTVTSSDKNLLRNNMKTYKSNESSRTTEMESAAVVSAAVFSKLFRKKMSKKEKNVNAASQSREESEKSYDQRNHQQHIHVKQMKRNQHSSKRESLESISAIQNERKHESSIFVEKIQNRKEKSSTYNDIFNTEHKANNDEYFHFFDQSKKAISTDHESLWMGFQAIFHKNESFHSPLVSSDEKNIGKKHKLDSSTKESYMQIYQTLLKVHRDNNVGISQLMNDKTYYKKNKSKQNETACSKLKHNQQHEDNKQYSKNKIEDVENELIHSQSNEGVGLDSLNANEKRRPSINIQQDDSTINDKVNKITQSFDSNSRLEKLNPELQVQAITKKNKRKFTRTYSKMKFSLTKKSNPSSTSPSVSCNNSKESQSPNSTTNNISPNTDSFQAKRGKYESDLLPVEVTQTKSVSKANNKSVSEANIMQTTDKSYENNIRNDIYCNESKSVSETNIIPTINISYENNSSNDNDCAESNCNEKPIKTEIAHPPSLEMNLFSQNTDKESHPTFNVRENSTYGKIHVKKYHICFTCKLSSDTLYEIPRNSIESLTLHNDGTSAEFTLVDNRTRLFYFETTSECLRFAAAFYITGDKNDSVDQTSITENSSTAEEVISRQNEDSESTKAQSKIEKHPESVEINMNKDVLKPRTKSENCDPVDSNASCNHEDSKNDNETKLLIEKYQKMKKMGIPIEAIKQKMTLDGVHQNIAETIFDLLSNTKNKKRKDDDSTFDVSSVECNDQISQNALLNEREKCLEMDCDGGPIEVIGKKMSSKGNFESLNCDDSTKGIASPKASLSIEARTTKEQQLEVMVKNSTEQVASKYLKMKKVGIPVDAILQKMSLEGAEDKVVKFVMDKFTCNNATKKTAIESIVPKETVERLKDNVGSNALTLSTDEEKIASTYRKMLKVRIPPEAVRHKMTTDRISTKIIAAVVGIDSVSTNKSEKKVSANSTKLNVEEEKIAMKYRKMLKVAIPAEAVRHKMLQDQIGKKIIDNVLGENQEENKMEMTPKLKARSLITLHWTPLSPKSIKESVWGIKALNKEGTSEPKIGDITKLEKLFHKKKSSKIKTIRSSHSENNNRSNRNSKEMAKLIDLTRANNIAISLKAFKEFNLDGLANTLADLDPARKISGERVQFLTDILPTDAEARLIKLYKGSDNTMVPAELFFRRLNSVRRIREKVYAMQVMETFNENAKALIRNFEILSEVCNQVMKSNKVAKILETVLQIGNIMNEGTRSGGVAGFKFDSLLKLTQTKSADGKMTVLDYIIDIFISKKERDVLDFGSEFPQSKRASRLLITEMVRDVRNMRSSLEKCHEELEKMKEDQSNGTKDKHIANIMNNKNTLLNAIKARNSKENKIEAQSSDQSSSLKTCHDGDRSSLFTAIKARGDTEKKCIKESRNDKNSSIINGTDVRSALLASIKERNGTEKRSIESKSSSPKATKEKIIFSPGVKRLQQFMEDANSTLLVLMDHNDSAVQICKKMSRYFGEDGSEQSAAPILSVLNNFVLAMNHAVKKYDSRMAALLKKETLKKKKNDIQTPCKIYTNAEEDIQLEGKNATNDDLIMGESRKSDDSVKPISADDGTVISELTNETRGTTVHDPKTDIFNAIMQRNENKPTSVIQSSGIYLDHTNPITDYHENDIISYAQTDICNSANRTIPIDKQDENLSDLAETILSSHKHCHDYEKKDDVVKKSSISCHDKNEKIVDSRKSLLEPISTIQKNNKKENSNEIGCDELIQGVCFDQQNEVNANNDFKLNSNFLEKTAHITHITAEAFSSSDDNDSTSQDRLFATNNLKSKNKQQVTSVSSSKYSTTKKKSDPRTAMLNSILHQKNFAVKNQSYQLRDDKLLRNKNSNEIGCDESNQDIRFDQQNEVNAKNDLKTNSNFLEKTAHITHNTAEARSSSDDNDSTSQDRLFATNNLKIKNKQQMTSISSSKYSITKKKSDPRTAMLNSILQQKNFAVKNQSYQLRDDKLLRNKSNKIIDNKITANYLKNKNRKDEANIINRSAMLDVILSRRQDKRAP